MLKRVRDTTRSTMLQRQRNRICGSGQRWDADKMEGLHVLASYGKPWKKQSTCLARTLPMKNRIWMRASRQDGNSGLNNWKSGWSVTGSMLNDAAQSFSPQGDRVIAQPL